MNFDWDKINNDTKYFSMNDICIIAKCVDVYDGDSIKIVMPFIIDNNITNNLFKWNCRINGIDTPELRTKNIKEKQYAQLIRNALREKILNKMVYIKCYKFDKYGRLLIDIFIDEDYNYENINKDNCSEKLLNIANWLINNNYAKKYNGGKKSKWVLE